MHIIQPEILASARTIWDYLNVSQAAEPADAIFVFGSSNRRVSDQAAALFARRLADKILVTGNAPQTKTAIFPEPEALVFAKKLIALGIPENALVLETASTNTGENIEFGMRGLRAVGVEPIRLLLVAKPPHMRRCIATFARKFPGVRTIATPPTGDMLDYFQDSLENRPTENPLKRLAEEVDRLISYPELGYIETVDVPSIVQEAADIIRVAD